MREKDIPEFIYRGAIVAIDGQEQTIKDVSIQTRLTNGRPSAEVLYLEFKGGAPAMEYDARRVREIPGRLPAFLHEGAHLFVKDPIPEDADRARWAKAGNGEWEVTKVFVDKDRDQDAPSRIRLMLRRPWIGGPGIVSRHFNARTMTPITKADATPSAPIPPVYVLQSDITVKRLVLKRPLP